MRMGAHTHLQRRLSVLQGSPHQHLQLLTPGLGTGTHAQACQECSVVLTAKPGSMPTLSTQHKAPGTEHSLGVYGTRRPEASLRTCPHRQMPAPYSPLCPEGLRWRTLPMSSPSSPHPAWSWGTKSHWASPYHCPLVSCFPLQEHGLWPPLCSWHQVPHLALGPKLPTSLGSFSSCHPQLVGGLLVS